jgi:hypothetical protein
MTTRRLVWSVFAVSLVLVITGPGLLFLREGPSLLFGLSFGAVQIAMAVVGAVVATRLPRHPIGWLLLTMGFGLGLSATASAYGALGVLGDHGRLPLDHLAVWLGEWTFVPVVYGGVVFLLYLFPDGHFISRRWRRAAYLTAALTVLATVVDASAPGPLEDVSSIDNPVGATGWLADFVTTIQPVVDTSALPAFLCAAGALMVRFRRSHGTERQQLKWIVSALVLVGVGLGLTAGTHGFLGKWTFFLAMFSLAAMPVSVGMAMLRYRLYDIDVVINRALVYGSLSAALAGVYAGSVLLLQLALSGLTEGSGLAVAASTLAVAALFQPARSRFQRSVDRRFFRSRYDAARTIEAFGARLRDEVELGALSAGLQSVALETMRPAHVSLWLRDVPTEASS